MNGNTVTCNTSCKLTGASCSGAYRHSPLCRILCSECARTAPGGGLTYPSFPSHHHETLAHNGGRDASYTPGTNHQRTYHSKVGTHSNHHSMGVPDPNHTSTGAAGATEPHRLCEGAC